MFRCEFDLSSCDGIYLLGRWCERLPKDRTQQLVLRWEKPPTEKQEFVSNKYFQFISIDSVLEAVSVVPKPHKFDKQNTFCIDDDDRKMWVHTWGRSSLGEV